MTQPSWIEFGRKSYEKSNKIVGIKRKLKTDHRLTHVRRREAQYIKPSRGLGSDKEKRCTSVPNKVKHYDCRGELETTSASTQCESMCDLVQHSRLKLSA